MNEGAAPGGLDLPGRRLCAVPVAGVVDEDIRTAAGEGSGARLADPRTRPRHQGHLTLEPLFHVGHRSSFRCRGASKAVCAPLQCRPRHTIVTDPASAAATAVVEPRP